MVRALFKTNKDFDVLTLPDCFHRPSRILYFVHALWYMFVEPWHNQESKWTARWSEVLLLSVVLFQSRGLCSTTDPAALECTDGESRQRNR